MVFIAFLVLSICQTPNQPAAAPPVKEASAAEMSKVLRDLELAPSTETYWELTGPDGKTVGCSYTWVSIMVTNEQQGIRYVTVAEMKSPDGTRMEAAIEAHLTREYEPNYIQMRRIVEKPEQQRRSVVEQAQIKPTEVLLSRQIDDAPPAGRAVPKPDSPFVFGIECIIEALDCARYPAFELREFDPQRGTVTSQHFKVQAAPEGGHIVVSSKDDGSPNYRFEIDDKGSIVSWNETAPVTIRISTEKRIREIRKELFK